MTRATLIGLAALFTALCAATGVHAKTPAPAEAPSLEQRRREIVLQRLTSLGNSRVRDRGQRVVHANQTVGWLGSKWGQRVGLDAAFATLVGEGQVDFQEERGGLVRVLLRSGTGTKLLGELRTVGDEEIFVPTKRVAEATRRTIGEALLAAVDRLSMRPARPVTDSTWLQPEEDDKAPAGTRRISFWPSWKVAYGAVEHPSWTYGGHAADALVGPMKALSSMLYPVAGLGEHLSVAWVSDRKRDGSTAAAGEQVQHRLTFRPSYKGGGALYEEKAFTPGKAVGGRERRREAHQRAGWLKDQLARAKRGQVPEREWAVAQAVLTAVGAPAGRRKAVPNLALAALYGDGKLVFVPLPKQKDHREVLWQRADGTRVALGHVVEGTAGLAFEARPELLARRDAVVGDAILAALAGRFTWQSSTFREGQHIPSSSPLRETGGFEKVLSGDRVAEVIGKSLPPALRELVEVKRDDKPVVFRWSSTTLPPTWSWSSSRKLAEDQIVEHTLTWENNYYLGRQLTYSYAIHSRYPALQPPRRTEAAADRRIAIDVPRSSLLASRLNDVRVLRTREDIEGYVARLFLEHSHVSDDVAGIYAEMLSTRRTGEWKMAEGTEPLWREAFAKVGCISAKEALKRVSRRPAFKALVVKLAALEDSSKNEMWHQLAVNKLTTRDEIRTFIALYRHLFPDLALSYIYSGGLHGNPYWRAFAQGTKELWLTELRTAGAFENPLR
ncbi:MAG: hypothetical protein IT371_19055 [Deltaproteobacteria bacterium]|nr:hypothetical protein [Deltaproteobacteria bacterium]